MRASAHRRAWHRWARAHRAPFGCCLSASVVTVVESAISGTSRDTLSTKERGEGKRAENESDEGSMRGNNSVPLGSEFPAAASFPAAAKRQLRQLDRQLERLRGSWIGSWKRSACRCYSTAAMRSSTSEGTRMFSPLSWTSVSVSSQRRRRSRVRCIGVYVGSAMLSGCVASVRGDPAGSV